MDISPVVIDQEPLHFPGVANQAMKILGDPAACVDQAFTANVLRLRGRAFYGLNTKVAFVT